MGLPEYAIHAGPDDRLDPADISDDALEAFGRNCLLTDADVFQSAFDPAPTPVRRVRSHMDNGLMPLEAYEDDDVLLRDLMER
jgi:hypothetical protein